MRQSGPIKHTKDCDLAEAEICRRNRWKVGDRLSGVEDGKRACITITAIGREQMLAVWDVDGYEYELLTNLGRRNWRKEHP